MEPEVTPSALESTTPPPAAPDNAPLDPAEQHAAGMLERAVERAEGAGQPATTPRQAAPQPPPPAVQAHPEPPPQPINPALHPASQRFIGRMQERAERQAQAELAARLQRSVDAIERQAQGGPPAPTVAQEPDFDADPKAWYQQEMARQLKETLAPLLEQNRFQQESQQEAYNRQAREQQQAAWAESMAQEMDIAREYYAATPEGALFDQRFDWFVNDFMVPSLMATHAVNEQEAIEMAGIGIKAWTDFAMRRNMSPAVFVDTMIRSQVGSVANVLLEAGYQAPGQLPTNGNGHRQQPRRAPNPEIAGLRETAASAGSVAGIARQTTAPRRGGSGAMAVAADPTVENIRALADEEFGGDVSKAAKAVRRAAFASEQAGAR